MNRYHGDFFLNQLLTGHGAFLIHQHKYFGETDQCRCGLDSGTISHYLFGCSDFHHIRKNFFPADFHQLGLLDLMGNPSGQRGLKLMVQHLL
ncbi:hypothetical protein AVEN_40058-1 [Araneus ventricosus]|uniref:Reverse transcriptase zinc-binding domain-containing protein n=1 Tax=Araneus ventricosus TaxID=182803 RepID=A0A4Y2DA20_ARAVE|nr:hypothetical protein AVEN_40058-1 [Araneus ventricosus]